MPVLKSNSAFAALSFAGFVCWLAAFPMAGELLDGRADLLWFLLPHILLLSLLARLSSPVLIERITLGGAAATALLTGLFPLLPGGAWLWLALLGVTASALSLRAGVALKSATSPLGAALAGLIGGNIGMALLGAVPLGEGWRFLCAALALTPVLFVRLPNDAGVGDSRGLFFYLPFLFVFQIVSGLMYGFLFPAYAIHANLPGSELLFYMAGVALGGWLFRLSLELTLVAGVIPAMAAFAFLIYGGSPQMVNVSMYTMMAAAGIIDLFLLGYVLSFANTVRAYAYGTAVLCAGIVAGRLVSATAAEAGGHIGLIGSLVLNVAVLTLFFIGLKRQRPTSGTEAPVVPETAVLSAALAARLSAQEQTVLEQVLAGSTYKEIAGEMGIAESSVKTYMRRIYQKSNTTNKRDLLSRLGSTWPVRNAGYSQSGGGGLVR